MISGLLRLVVLRLFGARVLLVLGVLGWLRNRMRTKPAVGDEARRTRTTTRRAG